MIFFSFLSSLKNQQLFPTSLGIWLGKILQLGKYWWYTDPNISQVNPREHLIRSDIGHLEYHDTCNKHEMFDGCITCNFDCWRIHVLHKHQQKVYEFFWFYKTRIQQTTYKPVNGWEKYIEKSSQQRKNF